MIDPWIYPALTGVAVLTGFIDAIAGGGGLIMLPALLFAGVPPLNALATNKLQSMFGTATAFTNFARLHQRGMLMKRTTYTVAMALALALTVGACSRADTVTNDVNVAGEQEAADLSALNGVWKADLASVKFEGKPDQFLLQGGTWNCNTCIPPLTVAADGQFHPVADRPYYDSMSAKIVDDQTVEFHRRKGEREVGNNTLQVSADGNILTNKFHDATNAGSEYDGTTTLRRAGPAPAGAHAVSGQWTPEKVGNYTEDALKVSFQVDGNKVTSTTQGQTYVAEVDGPAVAVQNDPGGTTVAITREGAGLKETYTRDGKEVAIYTIVPNANGTSVTIASADPRDGSKTSWTANKGS